MEDELIAEDQHVVRHCESKWCFDDATISSANFELRKKNGALVEEYLSVGWLERYAEGNRANQVAAYRTAIHPKIRTIKRKDRLAVLNVGQTVERVRSRTTDRRILHFRHHPSNVAGKEDVGHSGIHETTPDEVRIRELLVNSVIEDYPGQPD